MSETKNIVEFPNLKAIEEEAALWIARLDGRDSLPASESAALKDWIAQSAQHRDALERMSELWSGLACLEDLNYIEDDFEGGQPTANVSNPETAPQTQKRPHWWTGAAVAASLLIAAAGSLLIDFGGQYELQTGHFATAIGEQETVLLTDGSKIILNTNSEITVDLGDDRRSINLLRGEAHFDVAPDAERPFLVYANDGIVKAVGTAFTVHLRKTSVEVTVSEGVVALISRPQGGENKGDPTPMEEAAPLAALTVGQSAVFAETLESLTRMSGEALDRKLLWRGGFIAFAGEPLSTVVADVSRYTDITIEIEDPDLESLPIGGYFKAGEVEDMFDSLEASFGIAVERISPTKVKLSRAS